MRTTTTVVRALTLAACVLAAHALGSARVAAQADATVSAQRTALRTSVFDQGRAHVLHALPAPGAQDTVPRSRSGWTTLRIAKWTTAAAATGLAVYGVVNNRHADHRFEELEQLCVAQPLRCDEREPDGSYSDAELENHYQHIRQLDDRARSALLAGQVGIAASVLLFVLDLRNSNGPENIPYEPRTFDAGRSRDGGLSLRLNLKVPAGR